MLRLSWDRVSLSLSSKSGFPFAPMALRSSGLVKMGISWTDGSCGGPGCSQDAGYYLGFGQLLLALFHLRAHELLSATLRES